MDHASTYRFYDAAVTNSAFIDCYTVLLNHFSLNLITHTIISLNIELYYLQGVLNEMLDHESAYFRCCFIMCKDKINEWTTMFFPCKYVFNLCH